MILFLESNRSFCPVDVNSVGRSGFCISDSFVSFVNSIELQQAVDLQQIQIGILNGRDQSIHRFDQVVMLSLHRQQIHRSKIASRIIGIIFFQITDHRSVFCFTRTLSHDQAGHQHRLVLLKRLWQCLKQCQCLRILLRTTEIINLLHRANMLQESGFRSGQLRHDPGVLRSNCRQDEAANALTEQFATQVHMDVGNAWPLFSIDTDDQFVIIHAAGFRQ